jgi:hypothetical protein
MRILGAIVQISALTMFDLGKQLAPGHAVAPQIIGHDHARDILQAFRQPSEQTRCDRGISPGLNEDVKHDAILVDRAPKIMSHTLDPDEYLVPVPLVPRSWSAASQTVSKGLAKFLTPPPNGLIGDDNAPLSQHQLNISKAHAEHVVQPDSMADDLSGKAMSVVRIGWRLHAASLARACRQLPQLWAAGGPGR